jgi:hypothetical protein
MPPPLDGPTPLPEPSVTQSRICADAYLRLRGFAAP